MTNDHTVACFGHRLKVLLRVAEGRGVVDGLQPDKEEDNSSNDGDEVIMIGSGDYYSWDDKRNYIRYIRYVSPNSCLSAACHHMHCMAGYCNLKLL